MSKTTYLKPLATVLKNKGPVRIDAFGSIRKNPYDSSNPLIDIMVSPLATGVNSYNDIMHPSKVHSVNQECGQISAGEFFVLHPGCVLHNNSLVHRPTKPTFDQRIFITPDKIQFIPSNLKVDGLGNQNFLIPPYTYSLGRALGSTLLAIEQNGDPYAILIPTMEILRSCYCSSSVLNQVLFSSDVDSFAESTVKSFHFDKRIGKVGICLRKKFPDADAFMIASILTNERAHREIKKIWALLVKQMYREKAFQPSALEIGFPSMGDIHLRGLSIELPSPFAGKKRRLITTLFSCYYPLAFSSIDLQRENPGSQSSGKHSLTSEKGKEEMEESTLLIPNTMHEIGGVNNPLSLPNALIDREFVEISSNRFPFTTINKIEKKDDSNRSTTHLKVIISVQITDQSTSRSKFGESNSAPINIVPKEKIKKTNENSEFTFSDFSTFNSICNKLTKSPHIESLSSIVINGLKNNLNHISQFPTHSDTKSLSWSIVTSANDLNRPRQLMLKKVTTVTKGTFYLMEIERKKSDHGSDCFAIYLISNEYRSDIPAQIFKEILFKLSSKHFKCYTQIFSTYQLQVKARNHMGSVDDCATALIHRMLEDF